MATKKPEVQPEPQQTAPVEPQPAPQAVPEQPQAPAQPVQQAAPTTGNNNLKFIVLGVVLIAAAVAGYGYWNGTQVKSYAEKSGKMMTEFKDFTTKMDKSDDIKKAKEEFKTLKASAEKNLADVEKSSAPGKAKELQTSMKEYFTVAKKLLGAAESIADWVSEFEKVFTSLESLGSSSSFDASSPEGMVASLKTAKTETDKALADMKKIEAPAGLEEMQKAFEEMLGDISKMYGKMIVAAEAGDYEGMMTAASDFSSLSSLSDPSLSENPFDKEYKADVDKAKELEKKIDEQINSLKNLGQFVF